MKIRNVSSSTVTIDTTDSIIKCNCTSNAIAVTLQPSGLSQQVTVKKTDSTANAVTIYPASGETIDGSASVTLTALNDKKVLAPVSGGWSVIDNTDDVGASIVTLTGTQTLTNKTLTSPKINENVALISTSTELNLLAGYAIRGRFVDGIFLVTLNNIAAADVGKPFFVAPAGCRLVSAYETHVTVCDAADTLTIEKCNTGEAPGAGDVCLATAFTMNSTANTPVLNFATDDGKEILEAGDSLMLKFASGDGTNYAGACITCVFKWT